MNRSRLLICGALALGACTKDRAATSASAVLVDSAAGTVGPAPGKVLYDSIMAAPPPGTTAPGVAPAAAMSGTPATPPAAVTPPGSTIPRQMVPNAVPPTTDPITNPRPTTVPAPTLPVAPPVAAPRPALPPGGLPGTTPGSRPGSPATVPVRP